MCVYYIIDIGFYIGFFFVVLGIKSRVFYILGKCSVTELCSHCKIGDLVIFKRLLYFLHVWVFCLHVGFCTICMECLWRTEEGVKSPETGAAGSCELPCEYWETN